MRIPTRGPESGGCERAISDLEGLAAAAASGRVRVVELEARAHDVVDVVDLGSIQIEMASRVDEEPDAVLLESLVPGRGLVVERELILEARAAAADHTDPEPRLGATILLEELLHFRGCHRSNLKHRTCLLGSRKV